MEQYGIGVLKWKPVENADGAWDAAWSLGYPVIMKSIDGSGRSPLRVVNSQEEMGSALSSNTFTTSNAYEDSPTFYIQKLPKGKEVSIGLIRNERYPPAVSLSLGGIFTSILNEVSYGPIPTEREAVLRMAKEIGADDVLNNGELSQLANTVRKISKIGMEKKEILEMDIKLVVHDKGVLAVDASMIVG